ncbi:MAG: tyrosine-type recombinase/integrase, partial [Mycobacteriales bacterium]
MRFEAAQPNETWQADFTHYRLADRTRTSPTRGGVRRTDIGTDIEILTWLDDCSRCVLSLTAHEPVTGPIMLATFRKAAATHGLPASTLTDNGKKISPTGQRMSFKAYSKNDQHRTLAIGQELLDLLAVHIADRELGTDEVLFPSSLRPGAGPVSRNTFRTKVWLPALERAGLDLHVRVHDLRHAHASWLLWRAAPTCRWSKSASAMSA